jgi:H+/Cl- antiporter ClcA
MMAIPVAGVIGVLLIWMVCGMIARRHEGGKRSANHPFLYGALLMALVFAWALFTDGDAQERRQWIEQELPHWEESAAIVTQTWADTPVDEEGKALPVVYRFTAALTVAGQNYDIGGDTGSRSVYGLGDYVPVLYDPQDPAGARQGTKAEQGGAFYLPPWVYIIGVVLCIVLHYFHGVAQDRKKRKKP